MARGVNTHFVSIVLADKSTLRNWSLLLMAFSLLLFLPAHLLAGLQADLWFAVFLAVGIAAGVGLGQWAWVRRQNGLRQDWNGWMKAAEGKDSIQGVWNQWRGKSTRNARIKAAMFGATFWCLEAIFVLLALSKKGALLQTLPFLAWNGLIAGAFLGYCFRGFLWTRTLSESLQEMVQDGEIGVWGVH